LVLDLFAAVLQHTITISPALIEERDCLIAAAYSRTCYDIVKQWQNNEKQQIQNDKNRQTNKQTMKRKVTSSNKEILQKQSYRASNSSIILHLSPLMNE
jgi:hypothetical protein